MGEDSWPACCSSAWQHEHTSVLSMTVLVDNTTWPNSGLPLCARHARSCLRHLSQLDCHKPCRGYLKERSTNASSYQAKRCLYLRRACEVTCQPASGNEVQHDTERQSALQTVCSLRLHLWFRTASFHNQTSYKSKAEGDNGLPPCSRASKPDSDCHRAVYRGYTSMVVVARAASSQISNLFGAGVW
jgi:hypothetical protein